MKKFLICAAVIIGMLCGVVPMVASAQTVAGTECDQVFAATVGELLDCEDTSVKAVRKTLYDIEVNPLGFIYEFTADCTDGYAVFLWEDEKFIPQEVIPEGASPYAEAEGKCVYVCSYTYLDYNNGEYADLNNGVTLSSETVNLMAENAVYGSAGIMPLATSVVTIQFASKDKSEYLMSVQPPRYCTSPFTSACACIAGANIIGFYDRYYENLIPDYEPGYLLMDILYLYYTQTSTTDDVIRQLYADMGTTDKGTTESQFKSGMTKYCNRAGYSISYTSMMSGGNVNFIQMARYMEEYNQPVALFLSGYNVADIDEYEDKDVYGYYYNEGNHVMVGFGYRYLTYTYSNSKTETFNLIYVASCDSRSSYGYYNIKYNNSTLNSALAINIY